MCCIQLICYVFILAVAGGQLRIVNDVDELTNEVQELRAKVASSNDKISAMNGELAQLKATISGKKLYTNIYRSK